MEILLELIWEYCKVANQKSQHIENQYALYAQRNIMACNPIHSSWNSRDLYNENYKTLKNRKRHQKHGKMCYVHGLLELVSSNIHTTENNLQISVKKFLKIQHFSKI